MTQTLDYTMVAERQGLRIVRREIPPSTAHLFSVDVEEHFQVSAFERIAPPASWDAHPTRVAPNTDRILDLLAAADAKGTFFTVGWVAERHPDLIRRIARAGHELGAHGWWHRRVTTQTPEAFRDEIRRTKGILEELSGTAVCGFRAPSFSIIPGWEWALDLLIEEGYTYDSSLFPIHRKGYGYPGTPTEPYMVEREGGVLWEFPPATTSVAGLRVPAAGGGYLRQFPFSFIRRAFRERTRAGLPGMFYIHPWEVDPDQPRLPVGWPTRVRHYRGLAATYGKLERLLAEFRFTSVGSWMESVRP